MAKDGGPGTKVARAARSNNTPSEDDEQTETERDMASSGRSRVAPHEGLVGAQTQRRQTEAGAELGPGEEDPENPGVEPLGAGADVAPTERAARREQERHRLEREMGRTPAGEGGKTRDERTSEVTRERLEEAARAADRKVAGEASPRHR